MSDVWTIADDGTIESRTRGRIGTIKHCEGFDLEVIRAAPELHEALRQIVLLDDNMHPGLASWHEARAKAHEAARAVLAKVDG